MLQYCTGEVPTLTHCWHYKVRIPQDSKLRGSITCNYTFIIQNACVSVKKEYCATALLLDKYRLTLYIKGDITPTTLWHMGNLMAITLVFIISLKARPLIHQTSQIALNNYITCCK